MNWYKKAKEDYRIPHQAPTKENGAPLHDLTNAYPDDIYSGNAALYYGHYGHNDPNDMYAISIIHQAKGKPNMPITIYRAVPDVNAQINKQIKELAKLINYFDTYKFFPVNNPIIRKIEEKYPSEQYTGHKYNEKQKLVYQDLLNQLNQLESEKSKPLTINDGDWVTINKNYAKEHGEAWLQGNYKILTKTVPARTLYNIADSIQEWGYNP